MASEIVLPQWGMEMQDGTIVRWLKQEGDTVAEGEPIVEVETAKLQTELESTASGVLSRIVAQEGEIVPIRGVLCVIAEPGEELDAVRRACRSGQRTDRSRRHELRPPRTALAFPEYKWFRRPVAWPASAALTWRRCGAAAPTGASCWPTWKLRCKPLPRLLLQALSQPGNECRWSPPPADWPGRTI